MRQRTKLLDAAIEALEQGVEARFRHGRWLEQTAFYYAEALYARGRTEAAVAPTACC